MSLSSPFLNKDFLKQLDEEKERKIYVKVVALNFNEDPIEEIQGRVTGGNLSVDGKSALRRTCSLTIVAEQLDIHNYSWGLNTKFKLYIGLENNLNSKYDRIIWFKEGIFIIKSFSSSQGINNYTINISGQDKMSLLNGYIGGSIIPLSLDFGTIEETDGDGNTTISSIPLKTIIRDVVHTYAREKYENIIINDLDECGYELIEYIGNNPLYLLVDHDTNEVTQMFNKGLEDKKYIYSTNQGRTWSIQTIAITDPNFKFSTKTDWFKINDDCTFIKINSHVYYVIKIVYGDVCGYRETDLTYAGDLIGQVGKAITTSCLDPIKNMLGNFEYYYDVDGRFIFQRKKNYVDISWNNLINDEEKSYTESAAQTSALSYSFMDSNLVTSFANRPNLENIKNDFSIWATKATINKSTYPIHLRYAIDRKPTHYKTVDGRVYDTNFKTVTEILQEVQEYDALSATTEIIANWHKMPLPLGLDSNWWNMADWGNLYKSLVGEFPNDSLVNYVPDQAERPKLDLHALFPPDTDPRHRVVSPQRNKDSLGVCIFDVWDTYDQNGNLILNGPFRSAEHNPYCGHNYTTFFVERGQQGNPSFTSYIYKPTIPLSVQKELDEAAQKQYLLNFHYGYDWREIIYQMAQDFYKYSNSGIEEYIITSVTSQQEFKSGKYYIQIQEKPDQYAEATEYINGQTYYIRNFRTLEQAIAQNNKDYYPTGQTGYETYYEDIQGFWRDLYDPEYTYSYKLVQLTRTLYEEDPSQYYWYERQNENSYFDGNDIYYILSAYGNYQRYGVQKNEFYKDPTKYFKIVWCGNGEPYDEERDYYTRYSDDYVTQKYQDDGETPYSLFGWSRSILDNPSGITFWFDFLDVNDAKLSAYNVRNIGDRIKAVKDDDIGAIYYRETPTVLFVEQNIWENQEIYYDQIKKANGGYTFIKLPDSYTGMFKQSSQKKSTKDLLDEFLYDYTHTADSISISAIPVYYLEPNTRIEVRDDKSGINGQYIIDKISYQLAYNGLMTINATRAIDRIV